MPLFRRRDGAAGTEDGDVDASDVDGTDVDDDDTDDDNDRATATPVSTESHGPWDDGEAPADGPDRIDLGALRVPVAEGLELRIDMHEQTAMAATLVDGRSALQVHAFAAPRSSGLWDEVRAEIADSLRSNGGSAEEVTGPFGVELRARIPGEAGGQLQPARFLGVDGPRWFLRGLLTGIGSTDPAQARHLEDAFRETIVVRGNEAMAPRDMLPLHLPKEALNLEPGQEPAKPTLEMLARGPEITETR